MLILGVATRKFPELSALQYYTWNREQLLLLLYTFYCIICIKIHYILNNRIQPGPAHQSYLQWLSLPKRHFLAFRSHPVTVSTPHFISD